MASIVPLAELRDDDRLWPVNALLRLGLTAVHQQFVHILQLRAWGDTAFEPRITAVDNADFPAVMRIMDHIVATGRAPELGCADRPFATHLPAPGACRQGILAAELAMERRLLGAIDAVEAGLELVDDPTLRKLAAAARSPRRPYAEWLERQLTLFPDAAEKAARPFGEATARLDALFANLVVAIEQPLAHAFVLRHVGEDGLADAAWAASRTAMRHATSLVQLLTAHGAAPRPTESVPPPVPPQVGCYVAEVLAFERDLVKRCRDVAMAAAEGLDGTAAGRLCREVVASFERDRGARSDPTPGFAKVYERHVMDPGCWAVPPKVCSQTTTEAIWTKAR